MSNRHLSIALLCLTLALVVVAISQYVRAVGPTAQLTLFNTVINNNGGTSTVAHFQLLIFDPVANSFSEIPSGEVRTLNPGLYTASENGDPLHYSASSWGGDCNSDGTILLVANQVAICTITNTDIPSPI